MDLERRLQRLERRGRSARWLGALGLLSGLGALAGSVSMLGVGKEIRARALTLVDGSGKLRAQLGPVQNGSYGLVLSDADGRPR
jgi:hypothetical protein